MESTVQETMEKRKEKLISKASERIKNEREKSKGSTGYSLIRWIDENEERKIKKVGILEKAKAEGETTVKEKLKLLMEGFVEEYEKAYDEQTENIIAEEIAKIEFAAGIKHNPDTCEVCLDRKILKRFKSPNPSDWSWEAICDARAHDGAINPENAKIDAYYHQLID